MLSTPITEQARKQERKTICIIARNNGFPLQTILNLKKRLIIKTHKKQEILPQKHKERNGSHLHITVYSYTKLRTFSKVPT